MASPKLSYIITTKNKLPYLKNRISALIAQKQDDEEILVADGASTDGTVEYLEELKKTGKIDYFISEPDYGESHALNKLLFAVRGDLIKGIADDDVYHYPTIRACKEFMLAHPEIDLIGSNGGSLNKTFTKLKEKDPYQLVRPIVYEEPYKKWQQSHTPFSFCGSVMLWRRSSLPLLGLFDTSFYATDAEFSFRTSAGKAAIAWHTGYSFVNIKNTQSVTWLRQKKIKTELERLNKFYLDQNPLPLIVQKVRALRLKLKDGSLLANKESPEIFEAQWPELFTIAETWLDAKNKEKETVFL